MWENLLIFFPLVHEETYKRNRTVCSWDSPRIELCLLAFTWSTWNQDKRRTHWVLPGVCSNITFSVNLFLKDAFCLPLLQWFGRSFTEGFKEEFSMFGLKLQAANKKATPVHARRAHSLCSFHEWPRPDAEISYKFFAVYHLNWNALRGFSRKWSHMERDSSAWRIKDSMHPKDLTRLSLLTVNINAKSPCPIWWPSLILSVPEEHAGLLLSNIPTAF